MSHGYNLQRETLLRNLERLVDKIPTVNLPVTVKMMYAFGGILREKSRLHDCDLLLLYSMTPEQVLRWDKFRDNFSTCGLGDHQRAPIYELKDVLQPFEQAEIPLQKAVTDERLYSVLEKRGVPPVWAGCFSWTEIIRGSHGDGIFYPSIEKIIRRLLVGRTIKGLQLQLDDYDHFVQGSTWLAAKNFVLAWSLDKPNVRENLERRPSEIRKQTILQELDHFVNHEIPALVNGTDLSVGYKKAYDNAIGICSSTNLTLDFQGLNSQHSAVVWNENESLVELSRKCELTRVQMRRYLWETRVLEAIPGLVEIWKQSQKGPYPCEEPLNDYLTLSLIEGIPKNEVHESDIREVLRLLKLPEDKVITIQANRYTYYKLAKNEAEKTQLLSNKQAEGLKRKYILAINKVVKPLEKDATVHLTLDQHNLPQTMGIEIFKQMDEKRATERQAFTQALESRDFKVTSYAWGAISGTKQVSLSGKESCKELQLVARSMLLAESELTKGGIK